MASYAKPLFVELAQLIGAYQRCFKDADKDPIKAEWVGKHRDRIKALAKDRMPSGSGFDSGTTFDFDRSNEERLVFHTSFHHMNGAGMYVYWTEHTITVKPSLAFGFDLTVSGRNRNDVKDLIVQSFDSALRELVEQDKVAT